MRNRYIHQKAHDPVKVGRGQFVQTVTPKPSSLVYLAAGYGNPSGFVPVNHADLEPRFVYEARVGVVNDGKVTEVVGQRYGPLAIETLIAAAMPQLEQGQGLCLRVAGLKKTRDARKISSVARRKNAGVLD